MAQRAYEWEPRPPTTRERIVCGIWLAAFLPVSVNDYAGWRLFRGYDNWVLGGLLFAGLFLIARLPGVRRVEGVQRPLSYWLFIGLAVIGVIVLTLLSPTN
jgi:hypothetical protein